jgi:hypothetical protein
MKDFLCQSFSLLFVGDIPETNFVIDIPSYITITSHTLSYRLTLFQSINNKMQRYTFFYFCKLLYMFRVVLPPIIRSITLYLQLMLFVKQLPLPAAIVEMLELLCNSKSSTIAAGSSNG